MALTATSRGDSGHKLFIGFVALVYVFLMLPIVVVFIASLNAGAYLKFPPEGISLRWYAAFFDNEPFLQAMYVSLRVAAISTVFSTAIGTLAAVYYVKFALRWRQALRMVLIAPMLLPEILTAIALLFAPIMKQAVAVATGSSSDSW